MFQFPTFAFLTEWQAFNLPGCPIRKSRDQGLFAPSPGLSQLITSFFASESQGIHRLPLLTFFITDTLSFPLIFRLTLGISRRIDISSACSYFSLLYFFEVVQYVKDLFLPLFGRLFVENNGFEPLTLCVQSRCSSQLS